MDFVHVIPPIANIKIILIMDKEAEERIVRILNESFGKGRNPSVTTLGGRIVHFDSKKMDFAMIFIGKDEFCEYFFILFLLSMVLLPLWNKYISTSWREHT